MNARLDRAMRLLFVGMVFGLAAFAAGSVIVFATRGGREGVRHYLGRDTPYNIGEAVDVPLDPTGTGRWAILVFSRSTCPACQESLGALKGIAAGAVRIGADMLIVTPAMRSSDREFAKEIGLEPDRVIAVDPSSVRARITPTLLVVDSLGHIVFVHEGRVDETTEAEVRKLLRF